eukprot:m.255014 g.255014  ORF g.255014 m.255014 type:complete len:72 (-) comp19608_c0_seq15:2387-2602(-)
MSPHASVPAQLLISALLYMYAADPAVSIGQSGLPNTDFFETLISPLSQVRLVYVVSVCLCVCMHCDSINTE